MKTEGDFGAQLVERERERALRRLLAPLFRIDSKNVVVIVLAARIHGSENAVVTVRRRVRRDSEFEELTVTLISRRESSRSSCSDRVESGAG